MVNNADLLIAVKAWEMFCVKHRDLLAVLEYRLACVKWSTGVHCVIQVSLTLALFWLLVDSDTCVCQLPFLQRNSL